MMKYELEKLILSLSASERKNFKLYCNKYQGDKDYLDLFNLFIDKADGAEKAFKKKYPSTSYENTAAYLFKILLDMLIQQRADQDKWFSKYNSMMKARLCFERSLPSRGIKELKKVQLIANETQDHFIHYLATRMELSQIADSGFEGLTEQDLINRQMSSRNTLQTLRRIHDHYSLYELLSHRLLHRSFKPKENSSKKLQDMVLSELSLTTQGSHNQYESKKLHLLFQSYFFVHIGEYKSAIKIFKELDQLIEKNEHIWNYPPYDYLSTLDGILDSLRNIRHYEEMEYYLKKAERLSSRKYHEHFTKRACLMISLYRLIISIEHGKLDEAINFFESNRQSFHQVEKITSKERHLELLFLGGLAFFYKGEYQRAVKCLGEAIAAGKNHLNLIIYRSSRLLYMVIHAEMGNAAYLQYEIRAFKRAFYKQGKLFLIEKLLSSVISLDLKRCSVIKKRMVWKKIQPQIDLIHENKNEQQLLKHFNFCSWIQDKLE